MDGRPGAISRRLRGALAAATAVAASVTPDIARAQIVNVSSLVNTPAKTGVSGVLEGSADVRHGNTRLLQLAGSALGRYHTGRHLVILYARGESGMRGDVTLLSKNFAHARYRVALTGPLDAEVFFQHSQDRFARLAFRELWGFGPRVRLAETKVFDVAVALSHLFEFEQLGTGPQPDSGAQSAVRRLSASVLIAVRPHPKIQLGEALFVQPRLDQWSDCRVLHEIELVASVTEVLAFKSTLVAMYDSQPPFGVIPLDTTLRSSVQLTF